MNDEVKGYEVWLSSDGKCTVRFMGATPGETQEKLDDALPIFDRIVKHIESLGIRPSRGPGRPPKFEAPNTPIETAEQREMRQSTDEALSEVKTACQTCGEPAQFKSGVSSKTGKPWKALFCSSGERSHAKWL